MQSASKGERSGGVAGAAASSAASMTACARLDIDGAKARCSAALPSELQTFGTFADCSSWDFTEAYDWAGCYHYPAFTC